MPLPVVANLLVVIRIRSSFIVLILAMVSIGAISCNSPPSGGRNAEIKREIGVFAWLGSKDGEKFLRRLGCKDDLEFIYAHRTEVLPLDASGTNGQDGRHLIHVDYYSRGSFVASWNDGCVVRFSNSLGPFKKPMVTILGHTPDGCLIEIVYSAGWGTEVHTRERLLAVFMAGALHTV